MGTFFTNEQGTAAIEYALLLSLIGMVVIGSLEALGSNIFDGFSTLNQVFQSIELNEDLLRHP
jgi:Flp pilus assembly pilin Flp